jgi:murein L,D-transpeptidase YafK
MVAVGLPGSGAVAQGGTANASAPLANARIDVFKARRELRISAAGVLVRTYRIALGTDPVSPKQRVGDRATPEGTYFISHKNPRSQYFLSLGISYPGIDDAARGLREGIISKAQHDAIVAAIQRRVAPPGNTELGGDIFVHGRGSSTDWTWGCIVLDDADMQQVYDSIDVGTPITIHP